MNEWAVVGVIVVLIGLIASVVKPLITLNTTLTKLTMAVDNLEKSTAEIITNSKRSHEKLWDYNKKQDARLDNHEGRITTLEQNHG